MKLLNSGRTRLVLIGIVAGIVFGGGSVRADFTFGEWTNLGTTVNSSYRDAMPSVSADDLVEPIICFGQGDTFDPSPENPLGSLVTADLNRRMASVRDTIKLQTVDNLVFKSGKRLLIGSQRAEELEEAIRSIPARVTVAERMMGCPSKKKLG
jgi:hypothetical protein